MASLATKANVVLCSHGGKASPTVPNMRVRAGGQPVVNQLLPYLVTGCPFATPAPMPCLSVSWLTGTLRVRSMGQPLLLTSSKGIAAPNAVTASILPAQVRVRGR